MITRLLALVPLLFITTNCYSKSLFDKSKPTYAIKGPISGESDILQTADKMVIDSISGRKEIQLVINSPGGEVITGFRFLNRMEEARGNGARITCFVSEIAASMAFQILLHCDRRIVLPHSFLLWHRARVNVGGLFGSPITAPQAKQLSMELQQLDTTIFHELKDTLGKHMTEEQLSYHFEVETLHSGIGLNEIAPGFLEVVKHIPGLMEYTLSLKPESLLEALPIKGQFIYITDKVQ